MAQTRKWPLLPEITRHIVELVCCKIIDMSPRLVYTPDGGTCEVANAFFILGEGGVPQALENIAAYACVCSEFREEVARLTFHHLTLSRKRLADIYRIVSPQRCRLLRRITLDVELEPYGPELYGEFETAEEVYRHSIKFSETLRLFFGVIQRWAGDDGRAPDIALDISAHAPGDVCCLNEEEFVKRDLNFSRRDYLADRYKHSILQLVRPVSSNNLDDVLEELPSLECVKRLTGTGSRHISATAWASIINAIPNAKEIIISLWENQKKDPVLRKRLRDEIGNALARIRCPGAKVTLSCNYEAPKDHECNPPRLIDPGAETDIFSRGLGIWMRQLKKLQLTNVMISPGVFSHASTSSGTAEVEEHEGWPHLESLEIRYAAVTPHGTWMLEPNPEDSPRSRRSLVVDIEEFDQESLRMEMPALEDLRVDKFRCMPVVEDMDQLYRAAGRAALQMPVLRELYLITYDGGQTSSLTSAPFSEHGFLYRYNVSKGVVTAHWGYDPPYRPAEDVVEVWKEVARKVRRCELEVVIDQDGV